MVMTRNSSPGIDPNWGYPQGGFTTWYPQGWTSPTTPPGMEGRPLKQKEQLGQQMPGAPRQQGSSSGAVTTGLGLKNSPFGQFGGFHPNMVGVMRKNFGL